MGAQVSQATSPLEGELCCTDVVEREHEETGARPETTWQRRLQGGHPKIQPDDDVPDSGDGAGWSPPGFASRTQTVDSIISPVSGATCGSGESTEDEVDEDESADVSDGTGTFMVMLARAANTESLGLRVDYTDGNRLLVLAADGGAVGVHNKSSPRSRKVRVGDYIVAVNGVSGDAAAMMGIMKKCNVFQLVLARPHSFQVVVVQRGDGLGASLTFSPQCLSLLITSLDAVARGAIGDHNAAAQKEEGRIQVHDRIVAVNGIKGDVQGMLAKLQSAKVVTLSLSRPRG